MQPSDEEFETILKELEEWGERLPTVDISQPIVDIGAYLRARDAEAPNTGRRAALERLINTGAARKLTRATLDMVDVLAPLQQRHPNFEAVIGYLRRHIALSRRAVPQVLAWPPLLLDGPPGVGKTHFARELANALGCEFAVINCSSVTANFVLAGSAPNWANSQPGKVFDTLCDSATANPVILLDEVDKLAGDHRFDGYGPLYQLLETDTAKQFVDEHLGLPIDASRILWVGTANDISALPEPIASRLEGISVKAPDKNQARAVAQSVYSSLQQHNLGWQRCFADALSADVAATVAHLPPRAMKQILLAAMGNAALSRPADAELQLRTTDIEIQPKSRSRPIGFIPS